MPSSGVLLALTAESLESVLRILLIPVFYMGKLYFFPWFRPFCPQSSAELLPVARTGAPAPVLWQEPADGASRGVHRVAM